ncbi:MULTISPECIES: EamA family transporter [unclassified Psychrobacter]|uniref:EamA family transporter n=1 Tax=unclassified Psychrobacter TaxID=196806 RepID=UPI00224BA605|nr:MULTISPECIES: EamA family transporter [unclassified Psychrobacter]
MYYFTIDKLGSVRAAGATYIAPVVAVIIAAFIGEEITTFEIVALVLITAGVVMIQLNKKKQAAITPTKKEATKKEAKVAL